MSISDDKFYAQKDANFRQRVYNILYNDSKPHSEQETLALINKLANNKDIKCQSIKETNDSYSDTDYVEQCITEGHDYRDCVDTLVDNMKSS